MSLLRIRCSLNDQPERCQWVLLDDARERVADEGRIQDLPRGAARVQLLVPASQVLITRAVLPKSARRRAGAVLAFAIEEAVLGEPESNHVCWLGADEHGDILAVIER